MPGCVYDGGVTACLVGVGNHSVHRSTAAAEASTEAASAPSPRAAGTDAALATAATATAITTAQ